MMTVMEQMGQRAKAAARILKNEGARKNSALLNIANALEARRGEILSANAADLENGRKAGLSESLLDRLTLTEERIHGMAGGARQVAAFADPVGKVLEGMVHPNGMKISKVTVPLGVIGMIYEARPNVTVDAAILCLKAGNAVILRGGKEAISSNRCLADIMRAALQETGLPADAVQLVEDTSRRSAEELMNLSGYLDVLIPRGGAGLIQAVVKNSHVPVIETGAGNCHIYVDRSADIGMASQVIFNAKTSRPSVCNACEKVLVHKDIAAEVLPEIYEVLERKQVEIRGCEKTMSFLGNRPNVRLASAADWETEYGDYIIGIKVVETIDEAIAHIATYSTGHSEAIITSDYAASQKFLNEVDSAAVYVNASTRFTDGGEFGLGAEIGISTQKLHARGPMGLNQLTSVKYMIQGNGQIR